VARDPKQRWKNIRAEPQGRFPPNADQRLSCSVKRVEMIQRFFYKKLKDDEERRS
jgi:hypothetical protein